MSLVSTVVMVGMCDVGFLILNRTMFGLIIFFLFFSFLFFFFFFFLIFKCWILGFDQATDVLHKAQKRIEFQKLDKEINIRIEVSHSQYLLLITPHLCPFKENLKHEIGFISIFDYASTTITTL
jgi:hypothetical protein